MTLPVDEWESIGVGSPAEPIGARPATLRDGLYRCVACDLALFESRAEFDFGTGCWPNFTEPVCADNIDIRDRFAASLAGHEVCCSGCGKRLGRLFSDGPGRTAERFCIERAAIRFAGTDPRD
jgi:peptide-methionine (R)-S-oxide reductase